jgi:hypothetical protein
MSMSPRHPVDQVADGAEPVPASASRRRFMRNVGMGAAALGAAAVTGTALADVASAQSSSSAATAPELSAADVSLLQFLQSLSLAAEDGVKAAAEKTYLQTELREEIRLFSRHHRDQAAAIGALLSETDAITTPNAKLLGEITANTDRATDQAGLVAVLLTLEEDLAATMLAAIGTAESFLVSGAVATIQPIVAQQAAALGSANDAPIDQWLPAFGTTTGAFAQSAYPVR